MKNTTRPAIFKWRQTAPELIVCAVRWYLRYSLSLRDVEELFAERGKPRRYHGTVTLDPARVGRDAGRIADEVVTHLVGLVGSSVRVTLEIEAEVPGGTPDNVVRT